MKKRYLIGITFAAFMLTGAAAYGAGGILGTAHDLSNATGRGADYGSDDALDRICVFCHAPHHTVKPGSTEAQGVQYLPLWNHAVTFQTYITYSNGPDDPADANHLSASEALAQQPGSVSRLCLSCHDGSVAINEYGFAPGNLASRGANDHLINQKESAVGAQKYQFQIGIGNDLRNHHPIGFDYALVQSTDDEIAPTTNSLGAYTIGDLLWAGRMECTTCHDVHNTKNTGEKFLWISDQHSEFCCVCHLKCE